MPVGPKGRYAPFLPYFWGIWNFSKNKPAAKSVLARLSQPDAPDGLICPGEVSAMCALAAIDDVGLVLGRDVDVIAKQTSRIFDLHRPRVDTIYEDIEETGRTMARALLQEIGGEAPEALQTLQQPRPGF